jgi:hypothetical protein
MKKKIIFGIALSLVLVIVSSIFTAVPAIAGNPKDSAEKTYYATIGRVFLQLPSNATYPAKAGGTPNHPVELLITVFDGGRRSTDGPYDQLIVDMWDPIAAHFTPVLAITDNPSQADFIKKIYNNTYLWYPSPTPLIPMYGPNLFPNVVLVQPNELEVWSETKGTDNGYGHKGGFSYESKSNVLKVNLTKAVKSTLNLFIINASAPSFTPARYTNATFNLPPLNMVFHELDEGYPNEQTEVLDSWLGASRYTVKETWTELSARVDIKIPDWTGLFGLDFLGQTRENCVAKFYPP